MRPIWIALAGAALWAGCAPKEADRGVATVKDKPKLECVGCVSEPKPEESLPASEAEWKKKLSPEQFQILRQGGTEQPYTGKWLKHKADGIYTCAGCGQGLYDSKTKYDACGWPSYWDALPGTVATRGDGGAMEAICSKCKGHLGHIFDDGPPPTGKRH